MKKKKYTGFIIGLLLADVVLLAVCIMIGKMNTRSVPGQNRVPDAEAYRRMEEISRSGWYVEDGDAVFYKDGVRQNDIQVNNRYAVDGEGKRIPVELFYREEDTEAFAEEGGSEAYGFEEGQVPESAADNAPELMAETAADPIAATAAETVSAGTAAAAGGWVKEGVIWCYYDAGGGRVTNDWRLIDGHWYYFDSQGGLRTGWVDVGGKTYFITENEGALMNGWHKVNGERFCFAEDGSLLKDTITFDGIRVDADGRPFEVDENDPETGTYRYEDSEYALSIHLRKDGTYSGKRTFGGTSVELNGLWSSRPDEAEINITGAYLYPAGFYGPGFLYVEDTEYGGVELHM